METNNKKKNFKKIKKRKLNIQKFKKKKFFFFKTKKKMTHLLKMENPFVKDPNLTSLVISLKRHKHKLDLFLKRYEEVGLKKENLTVLPGFDAGTFQPSDYPPMTLRQLDDFKKERYDHRFFNRPGGFGCYLSHAQAWKWCVDSGRPIFVFEDDAAFPFQEKTIDFIEKTFKLSFSGLKHPESESKSESESLILLGYLEIPGYKEVRRFPVDLPENGRVVSVQGLFHGTHLYYITPKAALKLLEKAFPIEMQVDSYMGLMTKYKGLNCKAYSHPLLSQANLENTTIQEKCVMCNGKVNASRFNIESKREKNDVCKETGACGASGGGVSGGKKAAVLTGVAACVFAILGLSNIFKKI